jgi:hypothetical protein
MSCLRRRVVVSCLRVRVHARHARAPPISCAQHKRNRVCVVFACFGVRARHGRAPKLCARTNAIVSCLRVCVCACTTRTSPQVVRTHKRNRVVFACLCLCVHDTDEPPSCAHARTNAIVSCLRRVVFVFRCVRARHGRAPKLHARAPKLCARTHKRNRVVFACLCLCVHDTDEPPSCAHAQTQSCRVCVSVRVHDTDEPPSCTHEPPSCAHAPTQSCLRVCVSCLRRVVFACLCFGACTTRTSPQVARTSPQVARTSPQVVRTHARTNAIVSCLCACLCFGACVHDTDEPPSCTHEPPSCAQHKRNRVCVFVCVFVFRCVHDTDEPPSCTHEPPSCAHARTHKRNRVVFASCRVCVRVCVSVRVHDTDEPPSCTHEPPSCTHEPPSCTHEPPSCAHKNAIVSCLRVCVFACRVCVSVRACTTRTSPQVACTSPQVVRTHKRNRVVFACLCFGACVHDTDEPPSCVCTHEPPSFVFAHTDATRHDTTRHAKFCAKLGGSFSPLGRCLVVVVVVVKNAAASQPAQADQTRIMHTNERWEMVITRYQRTRVVTRVHARKRVRSLGHARNLGARSHAIWWWEGSLAVKTQVPASWHLESHIGMSARQWRSRGINARALQRACTRASACARQTWGLVGAFARNLGAR